MNYFKKRKKQICFLLFLCLSYNLYYIYLIPGGKREYLLYLDFLLTVCTFFYGIFDYWNYYGKQKKKTEYLQYDTMIYQEFADMEDYEIAEHDIQILKDQLQEQFDLNCDLQDYIAKWCHEVKIPLAASLLMNQKIEDTKLRISMQEQLECINGELKSALLGCKVQSSLFDIQIKSVNLLDCVKTSIRNNQFFLIKNHFQVEINVGNILIYTDKNWLVYILDQLISNAIKYMRDVKEEPVLKIWSEQKEKTVDIFVEDHGEGIKDSDIRRIFEKGYTGSNHHNGKYKSTGMGLYMTAKIIEKLGHTISVESEPEKYTRFVISCAAQKLQKL